MSKQEVKVDRKAMGRIIKIRSKYGGLRPDLINMLFAERLHRLTIALIILTAILSALTIVQIVLLVRGQI